MAKKNTGRKLDKPTSICPLLTCAQVVFRANYMLEADHQGVALEIMSFCSGHYKHLSEGILFQIKLFPWISTARTRIFFRNQGTLSSSRGSVPLH